MNLGLKNAVAQFLCLNIAQNTIHESAYIRVKNNGFYLYFATESTLRASKQRLFRNPSKQRCVPVNPYFRPLNNDILMVF